MPNSLLARIICQEDSLVDIVSIMKVINQFLNIKTDL